MGLAEGAIGDGAAVAALSLAAGVGELGAEGGVGLAVELEEAGLGGRRGGFAQFLGESLVAKIVEEDFETSFVAGLVGQFIGKFHDTFDGGAVDGLSKLFSCGWSGISVFRRRKQAWRFQSPLGVGGEVEPDGRQGACLGMLEDFAEGELADQRRCGLP